MCISFAKKKLYENIDIKRKFKIQRHTSYTFLHILKKCCIIKFRKE